MQRAPPSLPAALLTGLRSVTEGRTPRRAERGRGIGAENGADETYLRTAVAFQLLGVGPVVEIVTGDHQIDIRRTRFSRRPRAERGIPSRAPGARRRARSGGRPGRVTRAFRAIRAPISRHRSAHRSATDPGAPYASSSVRLTTTTESDHRRDVASDAQRYADAPTPHFARCQSSPWLWTTTGMPRTFEIATAGAKFVVCTCSTSVLPAIDSAAATACVTASRCLVGNRPGGPNLDAAILARLGAGQVRPREDRHFVAARTRRDPTSSTTFSTPLADGSVLTPSMAMRMSSGCYRLKIWSERGVRSPARRRARVLLTFT